MKKNKAKTVRAKEAPSVIRRDFEKLTRQIILTVLAEYSKEIANINRKEVAIDAAATELNAILSKALAKIKAKVGDTYITKKVNSILRRIAATTSYNFSGQLEKIGVKGDLLLGKGVSKMLKLNSKRIADELKAFRDDNLKRQHRTAMRMLANSEPTAKIRKQITKSKKTYLNKAAFIARAELKETNRLLNEQRAVNIGATRAIWVTVGDGRVRACHKKRDGKEFDIKKGLYHSCDGLTLKPGEDFNCRCVAKYIIYSDDDL